MKKRLMMVMCCGIMILGNLSGCNAMKTKETEYHWPTSTLVKSLPVPESKYGEIVLDAEDSFEIDVFNTSKSQFADYINACKENGFNVDYYGTEDSYDAENKDGYTLSLSYDKRKKTMNIDIYDLDDDTEDTQEPEETEEPEETDDSENAKDVRLSPIRSQRCSEVGLIPYLIRTSPCQCSSSISLEVIADS